MPSFFLPNIVVGVRQASVLCSFSKLIPKIDIFIQFVQEDAEDLEDDYYLDKEASIIELEQSWEYGAPPHAESSVSDVWDVQVSNYCLSGASGAVKQSFDEIWENLAIDEPVSNYRTWETLGKFDPPKQPRFITETPEAMCHLRRIKHANTLQMASMNVRTALLLLFME